MQKDLRRLCLLVFLLAPVASLASASGHAGENRTENARPLRVPAIELPLRFDGDAYPSYELGTGDSFLSDGSDLSPFGWNAHYTKNVSAFGGGLRLNRRPSTDLTFLGRGGIDIPLQKRWALRTGVEYQGPFANDAIASSRTSSSRSPAAPLQRSSPSFAGGSAPRHELTAEYIYVRDVNAPVIDLQRAGWNVSFARNFDRSLGLVGEVGQVYWSLDEIDFNMLSFNAGLRYSHRGSGSITPYVEALGGFVNASDGASSGSGVDPAVQGGGGIDIKVSGHVSLRAGADYRVIFSAGERQQRNMSTTLRHSRAAFSEPRLTFGDW